MIHFWRIPRITKEDVERRARVEKDLTRLKETKNKAEGVSHRNRIVRQANHFSQAIFGGPRG